MNGDLREEMMCTLSDRQTGEGGSGVVKELQDIAGLGSLLRENDES